MGPYISSFLLKLCVEAKFQAEWGPSRPLTGKALNNKQKKGKTQSSVCPITVIETSLWTLALNRKLLKTGSAGITTSKSLHLNPVF